MNQEKTIRFKSNGVNYVNERWDTKCNTVRFTDDWNDHRWKLYNSSEFVVICLKENPKENFKRRITNKTVFKNLVIISWHPEDYIPCHTWREAKRIMKGDKK